MKYVCITTRSCCPSQSYLGTSGDRETRSGAHFTQRYRCSRTAARVSRFMARLYCYLLSDLTYMAVLFCVGSISHKNRFAVAVAVTLTDPSQPISSSSSSLGVDLEHCGHPDPSRATWRLLRRLLTETEMLHQRNSLQLSDEEDCDDDRSNRSEQLSRGIHSLVMSCSSPFF